MREGHRVAGGRLRLLTALIQCGISSVERRNDASLIIALRLAFSMMVALKEKGNGTKTSPWDSSHWSALGKCDYSLRESKSWSVAEHLSGTAID